MDRHDPGVFLGREAEIARLREAIHRRTGLAIWGPPDAGKTALVRRVIAQLSKQAARQCLHRPLRGAPHAVLSSLLEELYSRGDALLAAKFGSETGRGATFARWAKEQTSLRMRGLLYSAAQAGSYTFFLDDVAGLSDAFTRIVRELSWMRGTPVFLVARGCTEAELGRAARFYWNDEMRLGLGPLALQPARALLEHCIRRFGLSRLNLEGFREGILRFSGRLPGAIVKMCARAADTEYHFGGRVETRLLHVDYMMQFSYRERQPSARAGAIPAAPSAGPQSTESARK